MNDNSAAEAALSAQISLTLKKVTIVLILVLAATACLCFYRSMCFLTAQMP
jgi:hypothetical protein